MIVRKACVYRLCPTQQRTHHAAPHMRAGLISLVLCCVLLFAVGQVRAETLDHTYTSIQNLYAVRYPTGWVRLSIQAADFAAVAPDRNGFISISVHPGMINSSDLHRAVAQAFSPLGRLQGIPTYRGIAFHGTAGLLARARVTLARGTTGAVLAAVVAHHDHLYLLLGVVPDVELRSAGKDAQAVLAIVSSARFL